MHLADDRGNVVLAMRLETDVLQRNDLVITVGLFEGPLEQRHRVLVIAAEEFLVGAHDAVRGAEQPLARRIIPGPANQRANCLLGLLARRPPDRDRFPGERPVQRQGWSHSLRHRILSWICGLARGSPGLPRGGQLSRTAWCGLSSEKAGTRTQKLSPPRVSIS